MTPVQAFDSPQLSTLRKVHPVLFGAQLTALLMDMGNYISIGWNSKTVSNVAKLIADNFWMLRFDELLYAFRRGMEGGYGTVTFAPIMYKDLSQWLVAYQETERLEAEENFRSAGKIAFQETQTAIQDLVPKEKFTQLAHKFHCTDILKRQEQAIVADQKSIDQNQLTLFTISKQNWSDKQLETALENAENNGFEKTAEAIIFEMKVRAIPKRIKELAIKIARGENSFNSEELQLQANHPILLERELKSLKESK